MASVAEWLSYIGFGVLALWLVGMFLAAWFESEMDPDD